ncbi:alpha/beta fold hydrolase [Lacrimispora sp.]|jgi:pimeloyl-ACP methyl ester carboxylesterase|uniref:alpha/beta fold hydrolase n=1 Tax=Lacrimispora sp. TaxID=2719234 RepID=UPI0028A11ECB|nr:alpha/beta hydrolase [Lacrimispora sp.]
MSDKTYKEEFVRINGIEHYLLHYSKSLGTPVLLYLHSGPGFSESLFAYMFDKSWGDMFTHVQWDQRGAGKTLQRNKGKNNPESISQMIEDLHGIVQHLKQKYQTDKIVLLGHSWGSVLGSLYVLKHPEHVSAYIGSGQVVNMVENERVGYENAMKLAQTSGNEKHVRMLQQIGEYPTNDFDETLRKLPIVRKVQESYEKDAGTWNLIKSMFKSPSFKWHDLINMTRFSKANRKIIKELFSVDLFSLGNRYNVPVHYILGENDTNAPIELSTAYYETISADYKSLIVIPNAGHNPMFEQPMEFAKALQVVRERL